MTLELEQVVEKLVGPILPVGETHIDDERFLNLIVMCDLVEYLVERIDNVAKSNQEACEFSRKRARELALKTLTHIFHTWGLM